MKDWMLCMAYRYKIAVACWLAMLIVPVAGDVTFCLDPVARLDIQILEWFAAGRMVALDRFFTCISWAGSSFFLLPLICTHAVILTIRNHIREALFLSSSFIGGSVLNHMVKLVIARPRPDLFPAVIDIPSGFSFPSSHAVQITAFVLAELLLLKLSMGMRWLIIARLLGGLLLVVVCISRLYLQVHYPTDVVAGFLTAFFWVIGLAALLLTDHNVASGCRVEKGA
jgi:undecaprenyl-diphosphatase